MPARAKQWPLSIYLLKQEFTEADKVVRLGRGAKSVVIGRGQGTMGTVFYRPSPSRPPRWVAFFGPHLESKRILCSGVAAVLIAEAADRLFALTFGTGRYLLNPGSFQEGFGLRATLNSVSPDSIRTIDRKTLDATGRHSREQASRNIPIIEFGLDIDKDILCAVTGPPEDSSLGTRITGADALSVIAEVDLEHLRPLLKAYLTQYEKLTYRDRFPWVDNIREIGDARLCHQLDAELEERIRTRDLERTWMAVPDLLDWSDVAGFTYSTAKASVPMDDIGFESYLNYVRDPAHVDLARLHRHRVYSIDAGTGEPKSEWPVYKCIYAELDRAERTYLLNGGRWYEVARGYVREVDASVGRIPASQSLALPDFTDRNEVDYNRRVSKRDPVAYALMDQKMIQYGGGVSRIEFCDLYTRIKQIVHVKRYGGSGTLSHLFAQGRVSSTLFLNDPLFRTAVNKLLPGTHKLRSPGGPVKTSEYEVAYVIASKASGPLVLPFFSRVTLRSAATELRNMGYRVTLNKVQCA
ncbi:MAG: TIGR04141 family sporadically distributed protein [Acidobacteriota bacterium]